MILLDTHALVYDAIRPQSLSRAAARAINAGIQDGELCCADVSLWEIATLIDRGRLKVDASIDDFLRDVIARRAFTVLSITPAIAARAQTILPVHRDPMDRIIAATAAVHDARLITSDETIRAALGRRVIW